jgi:hypothetical protein
MPGRGRPPYVPNDRDRRLVQLMTAGGIDQRNVATGLGIAPATLRKYYRPELKAGGALANAMVIASLFRIATGDDANAAVAAGIWWTKCRMGWAPKHEFSGQGGTPLNPPRQSYVVRMPTPADGVSS